MSDFVHLHCHTEYSLLDGAIRINDLCQRAKDFGFPAVAITDHGNLYGALNFYLAAKKFGLKPIIGCEVYVAHDHTDRVSEHARDRFHLVLLAQNKTGYQNLVKLVSHGALYGFYMRPRVDKKLLRQYSEGLIALSACIGGEVPKVASRAGIAAAVTVAREYADIYPERFYLELQSNGLPEQTLCNENLLSIAKETGLPLVATNDCHYLYKEDAEAHDILLCIQTQSKVTDERRMRFGSHEFYYKSPEEMEKDFGHLPESLENTLRIANSVEDYDFDFNTYHFPVYDLPEGITLEEEFRTLARKGLERRFQKMYYPFDRKIYEERLELELSVICEMQFPGYFLIVQDFINWAKDAGIPVGPGRGSAAGSLVAFALRITNIDPIPYNLLFERFLNNERVSMPDIDVDFCEENRQKVIEYVIGKYGAHSVAQITTFGKMMAKGVVRDVGRALGMLPKETDRITKLIPADLKMTISKALDLEPELATLYSTDPLIQKLLDTSMRLEGLSRHASIHAAGLVISDKPMVDYLPLYRGKREEDIVTQFDMKMVEKVGLVKFDFLGLRNMTIIEDTLKNIVRQGKISPELEMLSLDDGETYRLYASGDTDGIFQVESSGMRQYLRMLRPTVFEDIIAMLALYRPGPLKSGMVLEFIKRKHGHLKVSFPLPNLEPCLKDTYGVIVYQEQVMQIAQVVAGYSLGGADLLRRAMGKKDPEAMAKERSKFVSGAVERGVNEEKANEIFDLMEKFAEYGFNKSHSAAYALISYHTAYLKTHFPTEFMAALLSSEMGNHDKLLKYVAACKDMQVQVLAPSVQKSDWKFAVDGDSIVFGLGGIKNVGEECVKELVEVRDQDGPFTSFLDLCSRVSLRKMTKRVLESLIKAGACDCFGVTRAALLAALDVTVQRVQKQAKEKNSNQVSLFSLVPDIEKPALPGLGFHCEEEQLPEWANDLLARNEKEALGFFLNNHPLVPYRREIRRLNLTPLEELRDMPPQTSFASAVLRQGDIRVHLDRRERRWGLLQVEDLTGAATCLCFSDEFALYQEVLLQDLPLYIEGELIKPKEDQQVEFVEGEEAPPREIKIRLKRVTPLTEACAASSDPVVIQCDAKRSGRKEVEEKIHILKHLLHQHKGTVPVQFVLHLEESWCLFHMPGHAVLPSLDFYDALTDWQAT